MKIIIVLITVGNSSAGAKVKMAEVVALLGEDCSSAGDDGGGEQKMGRGKGQARGAEVESAAGEYIHVVQTERNG